MLPEKSYALFNWCQVNVVCILNSQQKYMIMSCHIILYLITVSSKVVCNNPTTEHISPPEDVLSHHTLFDYSVK